MCHFIFNNRLAYITRQITRYLNCLLRGVSKIKGCIGKIFSSPNSNIVKYLVHEHILNFKKERTASAVLSFFVQSPQSSRTEISSAAVSRSGTSSSAKVW